jgi:hypothetical protein
MITTTSFTPMSAAIAIPIPERSRSSSGSWSPSPNSGSVLSSRNMQLSRLPPPLRSRAFSTADDFPIVGSPLIIGSPLKPESPVARLTQKTGLCVLGTRPQFDILELNLRMPTGAYKILMNYAVAILTELNAPFAYINNSKMLIIMHLPNCNSPNILSVGARIAGIFWKAKITDPSISLSPEYCDITGSLQDATKPINMFFDRDEVYFVKSSGKTQKVKPPTTVDEVNSMLDDDEKLI